MNYKHKDILCSIVLIFFLATLFSCGEKGVDSKGTGTATQRPYVIKNKRYYPLSSSAGYVDTGLASWYGPGFHGRSTSNGEKYNMHSTTAAHKTLPMNTMVLVKNLENGKETVVRINDRGPFVRGRIIDLSHSSAKKLGILKNGTAKVQITALADSKQKAQKPNFNKGEFYVQIGAFQNEQNALKLQKRFKDAGHEAVIRKLDEKETAVFQVQVYVGSQIREAIRAESLLLDRGYEGAFIVAR